MRRLKVAVLMGGRSPEYEVSLATGREVLKHLDRRRYQALPVVISRDGRRWQLSGVQKFLADSPGGGGIGRYAPKKLKKGVMQKVSAAIPKTFEKRKIDVFFIAMHGPFGEDGTVQGMLELMGVPYIGSGVLASALGMNKIMFRKVMEKEKIPVPKYLVFEKGKPLKDIWRFFKNPPVFVKPYNQGSSVGTSIVKKKSQVEKALRRAFSYSDPVLVEEYLAGLEVSCGVLGNDNPFALPVAEIVPKNEFFDYEAKYTPGKSEEIVPARISKSLTLRVQKTAVTVFKAIGARGFARVDMIIKDKTPVVLEINTIPGLTSVSILPKEAASAGISYPALLDRIIELALESW